MSDEFEDVARNDEIREERLKYLGYHLVRFYDWEVLNDLGLVAELLTVSKLKAKVTGDQI